MKEPVTLIFDLGKTNKKLLLFDSRFDPVHQEIIRIDEVRDEEGFPCDDIDAIESWIDDRLAQYLGHRSYDIHAVNFSTYGASLLCVDQTGKRISPLYNYLKPYPVALETEFYEKYGGKSAFSRKTASPSLGMLNSGLQIYWLKYSRRSLFERTDLFLHFPQYLSGRLTGESVSEYTSVGCHTALWDFDRMQYHRWVKEEKIRLPVPGETTRVLPAQIKRKRLLAGTGIHDSSASLLPYLHSRDDRFILVSTGTWCINMNPFNNSELTLEELQNDCLNFLSINGSAIKSSRFFLGRIHDVNTERISTAFRADRYFFRSFELTENEFQKLLGFRSDRSLFFPHGIPDSLVSRCELNRLFSSTRSAYARFMLEITGMVKNAIDLIIPQGDSISSLFVVGGFTANKLFTRLLASLYPDKHVYISEMQHASALGAAMVLSINGRNFRKLNQSINPGLQLISPYKNN